MQGQLDPATISVIAGVLLANIGCLIGAYVSIVTRLTRIEVKVDTHEKDLNNLGGKLREQQEYKEPKTYIR